MTKKKPVKVKKPSRSTLKSRTASSLQTVVSPFQRPNPHRAATDAAILDTLLAAMEKKEPSLTAIDLKSGIVLRSRLDQAEASETLTIRIGQYFGKWKIISLKYSNPSCTEPHFLLKCSCGKIQARPRDSILSGLSTSCGC